MPGRRAGRGAHRYTRLVSLPVQPVTFYVSSSSTEPVEVRVSHSGLRMMLVNRESLGLLDDSWAVLGVYFLLGPFEGDPDLYRAYVGEVGKRTLLLRIKEHVDSKQWWSRALLIASASDEFNSAEIGWLEGRLYDVLNNAVAAEVMNKGRPGDDSLAPQDRGVLERYVEPIMAALRACGASPDTADQRPQLPKGHKKKVYKESYRKLGSLPASPQVSGVMARVSDKTQGKRQGPHRCRPAEGRHDAGATAQGADPDSAGAAGRQPQDRRAGLQRGLARSYGGQRSQV